MAPLGTNHAQRRQKRTHTRIARDETEFIVITAGAKNRVITYKLGSIIPRAVDYRTYKTIICILYLTLYPALERGLRAPPPLIF